MMKTLTTLLTTLPATAGYGSTPPANEHPGARRQRLERLRRTADGSLARGYSRGALRLYRRLLAECPEDLQILNRTGELLARVRQTDQAVALFVRVARAYAATGFEAKAAAMYRKVLRLEPNHPDGLGYLYGSLEPGPDEPR